MTEVQSREQRAIPEMPPQARETLANLHKRLTSKKSEDLLKRGECYMEGARLLFTYGDNKKAAEWAQKIVDKLDPANPAHISDADKRKRYEPSLSAAHALLGVISAEEQLSQNPPNFTATDAHFDKCETPTQTPTSDHDILWLFRVASSKDLKLRLEKFVAKPKDTYSESELYEYRLLNLAFRYNHLRKTQTPQPPDAETPRTLFANDQQRNHELERFTRFASGGLGILEKTTHVMFDDMVTWLTTANTTRPLRPEDNKLLSEAIIPIFLQTRENRSPGQLTANEQHFVETVARFLTDTKQIDLRLPLEQRAPYYHAFLNLYIELLRLQSPRTLQPPAAGTRTELKDQEAIRVAEDREAQRLYKEIVERPGVPQIPRSNGPTALITFVDDFYDSYGHDGLTIKHDTPWTVYEFSPVADFAQVLKTDTGQLAQTNVLLRYPSRDGKNMIYSYAMSLQADPAKYNPMIFTFTLPQEWTGDFHRLIAVNPDMLDLIFQQSESYKKLLGTREAERTRFKRNLATHLTVVDLTQDELYTAHQNPEKLITDKLQASDTMYMFHSPIGNTPDETQEYQMRSPEETGTPEHYFSSDTAIWLNHLGSSLEEGTDNRTRETVLEEAFGDLNQLTKNALYFVIDYDTPPGGNSKQFKITGGGQILNNEEFYSFETYIPDTGRDKRILRVFISNLLKGGDVAKNALTIFEQRRRKQNGIKNGAFTFPPAEIHTSESPRKHIKVKTRRPFKGRRFKGQIDRSLRKLDDFIDDALSQASDTEDSEQRAPTKPPRWNRWWPRRQSGEPTRKEIKEADAAAFSHGDGKDIMEALRALGDPAQAGAKP